MKTAHKGVDLKGRHVTAAGGNVFADLGFSPKEAKALLKHADARIIKAQRLKEDAAIKGGEVGSDGNDGVLAV